MEWRGKGGQSVWVVRGAYRPWRRVDGAFNMNGIWRAAGWLLRHGRFGHVFYFFLSCWFSLFFFSSFHEV